MPAYAGLWDGIYNQPYTFTNSRTKLERDVSMAFERRGGQVDSALAIALNGAVPGARALRSRTRVLAMRSTSGYVLGGVRPVEFETVIDRSTTVADQTAMNAIYDGTFGIAVAPVDRSGNGGGGKAGSL